MSYTTPNYDTNSSEYPTSYSSITPSSIVTTTSGQHVVTTTITSGTSYPTQDTSSKSNVPIGPIVGGVVGGAFLAVVAVVIWKWWGYCIKRQVEKDRKEALERRKMHQNTRRNASSGAFTGTALPSLAMSQASGKRVSFTPAAPAAPKPILKPTKKGKARAAPAAATDVAPRPRRASAPRLMRPSPLSQSVPRPSEPPVPSPPSPGVPLRRHKSEPESPSSPIVQPFLRRPVMPQRPSTMMSESEYSAESGEEHQHRVSASLIMAALGHLDVRRSLANYLPLSSGRNSGVDHNRLSHFSGNSAYERAPDDEETIGVAYGGEEGLPPADRMV